MVLALLATACQGEESQGAAGRSPFTGKRVDPERETGVLAVKVDNVGPARPHTGLERADLVYVEQVESGLSRILAVFSSRLPERVGPVRSARESDLELLRQFGDPALAYSGVQSKLRPTLERAPLHPVPPGQLGDGYSRAADRPAPHNLYVDPSRALRAATGAATPRDIGFRFGAPPEGGERLAQQTVRYPAARLTFDWSRSEDRWLVSMDGDPARVRGGDRLGAPTVVVQYVTIRPSRFRDSSGSVTPYTETVGSGTAKVLRGGRSYAAEWRRPSAESGTTFQDADGERLAFARGPVWIVLAPAP
ncbi:DUF3048 domain-containing protein [Streptomyces sp. AJS327]|uniref:DUF3048 domain-containing protein n=1 Tax=Streptomyces sp. AJS327 TaxID=2545265 RepID=UPI0015E014B3|nr:DUF3048 domain-containing protein [Streptomyces sp. AJS327]MBA0054061.1 DUF3048 domain-containing protein [Streptomyces sp. AJS327]